MSKKSSGGKPSLSVEKSAEIKNIDPKTVQKFKKGGLYMALLPLAACGGGGGNGGGGPAAPAPAPPPTPDPDFTENPTNVFIALDDNDRTLSEGGNANDLTVLGKAGADSITTGSGDDMIRGGEGRDTVLAGAGDDAIVIVGTTTAGQYTDADITNAGGGIDLSALITLADLNGRTVSEVVAGEVIDGGTGTNTLYIYGAVDLTGVTLSNVTILEIHSDVTLSPEQIAQFTTVNGDGTSTINIEVPNDGNNYILDLSALDCADISAINIAGDITVQIDDADDLGGIVAISSGAGDSLTVDVQGTGSDTTVNLGDIADVIESADTIEVAEDVTLEIDNADDITDLGVEEIMGSGDVETNGDPDVADALDDVEVDEEVEVVLPTLSINDRNVNEAAETVTFTVTLSESWSGEVTVDYSAPDGSSGTLTFAPGETEKTFTSSWSDDNIDEADEVANATLTNPSNATIADGSGQLTIQDDDLAPTISIDDVAADEEQEYATFTVTLSNESAKTVTVDYVGPGGAAGTLTFEPGETEKTFDVGWNDDLIEEADEILAATLSNPGNATIADGSGQLTIKDDDTPVNINGTDGADEFSTTTDIENFNTGGGNDKITINADDSSEIEDSFDGGEGWNTLVFAGSGLDIDLSTINFSNFAVINISGSGANTAFIDFQTAQDVEHGDGYSLRITGDGDDTLTTDANWNFFTASVTDGVLYYVFETNGFDTLLHVDAEIGTISGFPAVPATFVETTPNTFDSIGIGGSYFTDRFSTEDLTVTISSGGGYIVTGAGDDTLTGSNSAEALYSHDGDDTINAGGGNDYVVGGDGADTLDGGWGLDTVSYAWSDEAVNVNLSTNQASGGHAEGDIISNFEEVVGSDFDDTLTGTDSGGGLFQNSNLYGRAGDDTITGGDAHDYISGGSGDDTIDGGDGGDYIEGGSGGDIMNGGAGADTFEVGFDDDIDLDKIDGGSGQDKLLLVGEQNNGPTPYDLGAIDVSNMEIIYFSREVELTLTAQDVIDATDSNNQLIIETNGDVTLNTSSIWTFDGSVISGITVYNSYSSGDATLLLYAGGSEPTLSGFPLATGAFEQAGSQKYEAVRDDNSTFDGSESYFNMTISGQGGDDVLIGGTADDTIIGGAGSDDISSGDGSDVIRGGLGADTIAAGDGDDHIVVVGTTTTDQYDYDAISYPGGGTFNLTSVLSLETLNNQAQSEVASGETIDGGEGTNTLYVYGTADFTDVTLNNVNILVVNSDVTLTADQIAGFTSIDGDGSSVINIEVPDDENDYILDLTALDITDISQIHVNGDLTFIIDDATDFADISRISAEAGSEIRLDVTAQQPMAVISLEEIAAVFDQVIVEDYEGDTYYDPIIYNANSNFEADAASGFISDVILENDYIGRLYLFGDQTGAEVFEVDLTSYDLTELSYIYLSEDGREEITISPENIYDWDTDGSYFHSFNIYGHSDDVVNIDPDDWTYQSTTVNSSGMRYNYSNNETTRLQIEPEVAVNSGLPAPGGFNETSPHFYEADDNHDAPAISLRDDTIGAVVNGSHTARNYIVTGSGNDQVILTGSSSYNYILTGAGDDVITGGDGRDYIRAKDGDDTLIGGDGDDRLYGGAGADHMDGGDGDDDQLNYYRSPEAIYINLSTNTVYGGFGDGDTFLNIESVIGTAFDDTIIGDANSNYLFGDGGYDIIHGGGGNDRLAGTGELYGEAGNDVVYMREGSDFDATYFDGGADIDLVRLDAEYRSPTSWVLDAADLNIENIEILQFDYNGSVGGIDFSIDAEDVIDLTDGNNTLYIGPNSWEPGMLVSLSTGSTWTYVDDVEYTFNDWSNDITGEFHHYTSGGATLYVSIHYDVQTGFPAPITNFTETDTNEYEAPTGKYGYFKDADNVNDLTLTAGNDQIRIITGSGNDTITVGNHSENYVHAGGGNDTIVAGDNAWSAQYYGGDGDDTITAYGLIVGGAGADTMDGLGGSVLSYEGASAGIIIDLDNGTGSGGDAAGDTFVNFNTFLGTTFDDHIVASADFHYINPGAGDDTIIGSDGDDEISASEGADSIDGGLGSDTVSYASVVGDLTVNLDTGTASGDLADGDTLTNIENIYGTYSSANNLTGNAEDNQLWGGYYADTLIGGGGNDELDAGDGGADILDGGEGDDILKVSSRHADNGELELVQADGGDDYDILSFGNWRDDETFEFEVANYNFSNIEQISISAYSTEIILTAQDVIDITDANNTLAITGESDDVFTSGDTWTYDSLVVNEHGAFYAYTSGAATLHVSISVASDLGFNTFATTNFTETTPYNWDADDGNDSIFIGSDIDAVSKITGLGGDDIIFVTDSYSAEMFGGAGNDIIVGYGWFFGGEGADTMYDLSGSSWLTYEHSAAGVTIDLDASTVSGGEADGDQIFNFNLAAGSNFNDVITGNNGINSLEGHDGDDILNGGGGNDSLYGSDGDDTLNGDDGDDYLYGNNGTDTLDGGAGDDELIYDTDDSLDGGTGHDIVNLILANETLDFSAVNFSNIEEIVEGSVSQIYTAELTIADLIAVTDSNNQLIFSGDSNDSVTSTGEGWVQGADQVIDSETYHTYTAGGATLLIDEDIAQTIS